MINKYRKGYFGEWKLTHKLSEMGYMVVRTPRSGRIGLASPDIIALKNGRVAVIECKAREESFRVDEDQLKELQQWQAAGAKAFVAWKVSRKDWVFLRLHDVVGNGGKVGKNFAREKGFALQDLDAGLL